MAFLQGTCADAKLVVINPTNRTLLPEDKIVPSSFQQSLPGKLRHTTQIDLTSPPPTIPFRQNFYVKHTRDFGCQRKHSRHSRTNLKCHGVGHNEA